MLQRQFMQGVQGTCGMPWVVAWGIRTRMLWALEACFDGLCAAVHVKGLLSRFVRILVTSFVSSSRQDGTQENGNGWASENRVRLEAGFAWTAARRSDQSLVLDSLLARWLSLNKCTDLMNCRDWVACMGAAVHASSYWDIRVVGEKCEITYCVALVWCGCGSPCKVYWVPMMECGEDCNLSLAVHAGSTQ